MISDDILIEKAIEAQRKAMSPYSNYPVGAALLTKDNKIVLGCNIESKAYPTTLCAERVAFFSALSQGYKEFTELALITNDGAYPCGSCRQIIYEYSKNITIYVATDLNSFNTIKISELLPYPFS